jgi:hypothetical protein
MENIEEESVSDNQYSSSESEDEELQLPHLADNGIEGYFYEPEVSFIFTSCII